MLVVLSNLNIIIPATRMFQSVTIQKYDQVPLRLVIFYSILDQIEKDKLVELPVLANCLVEVVASGNVHVELEGVYLGAEWFEDLLDVVFYEICLFDFPAEDASTYFHSLYLVVTIKFHTHA